MINKPGNEVVAFSPYLYPDGFFLLPGNLPYPSLAEMGYERTCVFGYNVSWNREDGESIARNSILHSHWSRNVEAWLSLVESFIVLLRQLSYAIKKQLGQRPNRSCSSLVLYGIRAPILRPFSAWKPPMKLSTNER